MRRRLTLPLPTPRQGAGLADGAVIVRVGRPVLGPDLGPDRGAVGLAGPALVAG